MFLRNNAAREGLHMLVEHGCAEFMIISFQTALTHGYQANTLHPFIMIDVSEPWRAYLVELEIS